MAYKVIDNNLSTYDWYITLPVQYREFYHWVYQQSESNGHWRPSTIFFNRAYGYRIREYEFLEQINKGETRIVPLFNGTWWIPEVYFKRFGRIFKPQVAAQRGAVKHLLLNGVTATMMLDAGLHSDFILNVFEIENYRKRYSNVPDEADVISLADVPDLSPSAFEGQSPKNIPPTPTSALAVPASPEPSFIGTKPLAATNSIAGAGATTAMTSNHTAVMVEKKTVELRGSTAVFKMPVIEYNYCGTKLCNAIQEFLQDHEYFALFCANKTITDINLLKLKIEEFIKHAQTLNQSKTKDELFLWFSRWYKPYKKAVDKPFEESRENFRSRPTIAEINYHIRGLPQSTPEEVKAMHQQYRQLYREHRYFDEI
ncbi:hypothetical protein PV783_34350 [Chitinophaga sp. CC14]|uniref:hypothetical protein n=1 Tax=Chitinophaga sp. CC14 TaxID=3029199 RepID=UPI003B7CBE9B